MTSRLAQMQGAIYRPVLRNMHKYLSSSLNSVVSIDLETSWAAKSLQEALQNAKYARFQQKQLQEREDKLVRLYENQQQRAFERVGRGSAGSTSSLSSTGGKVRQMFDERRQKAGVDKSYPLEPLKKPNGTATRGGSVDSVRTVIKTQKTTVSSLRSNGNRPVTKREVVRSVYNNNNGDESYEERRFEDDNDFGAFGRNNHHQRDLIEMMNNHNLGATTGSILDDEEMPRIGFDDNDEDVEESAYFSATGGKLANLGGKLPSQNAKAVAKSAEKKVARSVGPESSFGKTFRKDVKPIVKRTVRPAVSPPERTSPSASAHSQPSKPVSTPISSPARSVSQTMQSGRASTASKPVPPSARTPSSARPSAKQSARSTVARDDLAECKFCKRRFATDRLKTHEQICSKTSKKKRKTYDATKHRIEGTELEQYVRRGAKSTGKSAAKSAVPKKDWRRTHKEFISAIRAAKQAQDYVARGGKLKDLPPPPPSSNPDYVQCPHCGRRFNEAAAERHIPKCASFEYNKPKPGQGAAAVKGSGKNVSAKK